jgi:hypothetical protein
MGWRDVLFPARRALPPARDSQEQMERWLADSFRVLGQICTQAADWVETQRLARNGYKPPDRFLERTKSESDVPENPGPTTG